LHRAPSDDDRNYGRDDDDGGTHDDDDDDDDDDCGTDDDGDDCGTNDNNGDPVDEDGGNIIAVVSVDGNAVVVANAAINIAAAVAAVVASRNAMTAKPKVPLAMTHPFRNWGALTC
jgi:hypothetical protein